MRISDTVVQSKRFLQQLKYCFSIGGFFTYKYIFIKHPRLVKELLKIIDFQNFQIQTVTRRNFSL